MKRLTPVKSVSIADKTESQAHLVLATALREVEIGEAVLYWSRDPADLPAPVRRAVSILHRAGIAIPTSIRTGRGAKRYCGLILVKCRGNVRKPTHAEFELR